MRGLLTLSLILVFHFLSFSQTWVDTIYQIQTELNVSYGTAIDFAGNQKELELDISFPSNDTVPECGRPLLVVIHGGAFITGDRNEGTPQRLREDFAKRGYVTASISYRLGQFPTHLQYHCNTQALGLEWDCMNMADTSEWYRAYFRGIQDANGAIRWLVNHAQDYDINPQNIFLVGESAGGYIAMGTGFIDDASEVLSSLIDTMPDVQAPNSIYESACVQTYQYDTSIATMDLSRPDLGDYKGTLNYPAQTPYTVRAVGNFFGGAFNNIFASHNTSPPALYLFHQPNDLIVPYNTNKILAGFATCATQFPLNCAYIINRPTSMGSNSIVDLLVTMQSNNQTIPDYLFDPTTNNADCFTQATNGALAGHAIDNYWLRTGNMAGFFAQKVEACEIVGQEIPALKTILTVYPNPLKSGETLIIKGVLHKGERLSILNPVGQLLYSEVLNVNSTSLEIELRSKLAAGIYYLRYADSTTKLVIE